MSLSALSARPLFGYCYQVHGPLFRYRGSVLCLIHLYPDSPNGRNTIGTIHVAYTHVYSCSVTNPSAPADVFSLSFRGLCPHLALTGHELDPWPLDLCIWRRGRGSYTLSPFRRCSRKMILDMGELICTSGTYSTSTCVIWGDAISSWNLKFVYWAILT